MDDLYSKVKYEDERIYDMLVRLYAQLTLNNKVSKVISDIELPIAIRVLENRLGIKE